MASWLDTTAPAWGSREETMDWELAHAYDHDEIDPPEEDE